MASRFVEEADNPLAFWLSGFMILVGLGGLALWLAKNTNNTGLARAIQQS
jgi:hypothetical protein